MVKRKIFQPCTICVTPYTDKSDYLKSLYQRLKTLYEVEAYGATLRVLPIKKWSKILHIHWIEYIYIRKPVIFLYLTAPLLTIALFFVKNVFRMKIVVTLHNLVPHENFSWLVDHAVFKAVLSWSDVIFVHSNYTFKAAKSLYNIPPGKIVKVMHPAWIGVYQDVVSNQEARERIGVPRNGFVFGFFGGIRRYKGVHLLLEAFQRLRIENTWLIIAGPADTKYLKELHRVIASDSFLASHVKIFPHRVKGEEVQFYIKSCDIAVVAYIESTTPASLLLFTSFGVPVIAPKLPSISEYRRAMSFFFKANDAIDLQRTMKLAVESRDKLAELGLHARDDTQSLTWDELARATYQSYVGLLSNCE